MENLRLELKTAVQQRTKRKIKRRLKEEEVKVQQQLQSEAQHAARKQIRKRTREVEKAHETEMELLKTMIKVEKSAERKEELRKKVTEMKGLLKDQIGQLTERIKEKSNNQLNKALEKALGKDRVEKQVTEQKQVKAAVGKLVADAAQDKQVAKRVKMHLKKKVAETKEAEQKKAAAQITQIKAEAFETISEIKIKSGHKSAQPHAASFIMKNTTAVDSNTTIVMNKSQPIVHRPKELQHSELLLKNSSSLHKEVLQTRSAMARSDRMIKELTKKRESAADPEAQEQLSNAIKRSERQASVIQGDYYHKTGGVPQRLQDESIAELERLASVTAKIANNNGTAAKDDRHPWLPLPHMESFKSSFVTAAVAAAAPKVAELRHKKATKDMLEQGMQTGDSNAAKPNPRILQAQIDAAKHISDNVTKDTHSSEVRVASNKTLDVTRADAEDFDGHE